MLAGVTQKQPGPWITCGMSACTQPDRVELCLFVSNVGFIGVSLLLCLPLTRRNGFGGSTWLWHLRWRFIARVARMGYNVMSLDRWDPRMGGTEGGTLGCSQSGSSGVHGVATCSVQGPVPVFHTIIGVPHAGQQLGSLVSLDRWDLDAKFHLDGWVTVRVCNTMLRLDGN